VTTYAKQVALKDEDVPAFENAVDAVEEELGESVRYGRAVREMAEAYTGHGGSA
jgi:hypothetical protein